MLFLFQSLLSVTACLHRYLQKENIDLCQAVAYTNAVTDFLKEKRSDATAADMPGLGLDLCVRTCVFVRQMIFQSMTHPRRGGRQSVWRTLWLIQIVPVQIQWTSNKNFDRMVAELEKRFSDVI